VDATAVEQAGKLFHVCRRLIVCPRQVQSRRVGGNIAGLPDGGPCRAPAVLTRRSRFQHSIGGRVVLRSGTRPIRNDTSWHRQNT